MLAYRKYWEISPRVDQLLRSFVGYKQPEKMSQEEFLSRLGLPPTKKPDGE